MDDPSSGSKWPNDYARPARHPRLTTRYCGECKAAAICGERDTTTACGDPAEYDPQDLHPITTPEIGVNDLLLPTGFKSHEIHLPSVLVVAKEMVGSTNFPYAVSADRLGGKTFRKIDNGIAMLVGQDNVIDRSWHRRGNLGKRLKEAGFQLAVAPGYSTYWGGTVLESMASIRFSAEIAIDLSRQIPVVPTLAWGNYLDLYRWVEWLQEQDVSCFAVHFGARDPLAFDWLMKGVEVLAYLLTQPLRLLAIGPSVGQRIVRLADTWPGELTIASGRPWLKGKNGHRLRKDLTYEEDWSLTPAELIAVNSEMFSNIVSTLVRQPRLRLISA